MRHVSISLCVAGCILNLTSLNAQHFSKHPTGKQIISNLQQQQELWQRQQVPRNSFFNYDQQRNRSLSYSFDIKRQTQALYAGAPLNNVSFSGLNLPDSHSALLLKSQLLQENSRYSLWMKQGWWKDPQRGQGSLLLREFFNNRSNRLRP